MKVTAIVCKEDCGKQRNTAVTAVLAASKPYGAVAWEGSHSIAILPAISKKKRRGERRDITRSGHGPGLTLRQSKEAAAHMTCIYT